MQWLSTHVSTMEAKMFSVWSMRWLYHEYEASSNNRVTAEKSASLVRTSMKLEVKWMKWISEEWIIAAGEYKTSAGEELTQCVYSKIETVIINCNSAWCITNKSRYKIENQLIIWRVTSPYVTVLTTLLEFYWRWNFCNLSVWCEIMLSASGFPRTFTSRTVFHFCVQVNPGFTSLPRGFWCHGLLSSKPWYQLNFPCGAHLRDLWEGFVL
jgi:hypothetical protein